MSTLRSLAMALLVGLAVAHGASSASAQTISPTSPMGARLAITGELQTATTWAQQVIAMIENTLDPEVLKRADALTIRAYLRLNAAVAGIQHLQNRSSFQDPLLAHATAIINKARETMSGAHTRIIGAAAYEQERPENILTAIQLLNEAIALARRAAELVRI